MTFSAVVTVVTVVAGILGTVTIMGAAVMLLRAAGRSRYVALLVPPDESRDGRHYVGSEVTVEEEREQG